MNQCGILMTVPANVSKRQKEMAYKCQPWTFTKQSIRHIIDPGETCHTTISEMFYKYELQPLQPCWCPGAEVIVEL